jgi:hypothetical protein
MSLSAALKAGLGQTGFGGGKSRDDAPSGDDGWDPYPDNGGSAATSKRGATASRDTSGGDEASRQMVPAGKTAPDYLKPKAKAPAPANVNQRPKQQVNARVVGRPTTGQRAPAQRAEPEGSRSRADWLAEPTAVPASRVNPQQFLREFERFLSDQNASAVRDAVLDVSAREIEGVARMAAKVRGRYLAKLIDTGDPEKAHLQEAEVRELARYREMHTELSEGVELLKQAILSGEIAVKGMLGR